MTPAHRNLVLASLTAFLSGASSVHCGGHDATGTGATTTTGSGSGGGPNADAQGMDSPAEASCPCFRKGWWKIDNLEPCFFMLTGDDGGVTQGAISTLQVDGGGAMCPSDFSAAPADWSTDSLQVDCAGTYQLCYTLKAGDPQSPQPTDCVVAESCVTAVYPGAGHSVNDLVPVADLPGWLSAASASACVTRLTNSGGYGEMSANGQSDGCGSVDLTFQHVTYCPVTCGSGCPSCTAGGGGSFMN
jgi:hypothetical protein